MTDILTHKILVIDDHLETLSIIQRVLQQHGYNVLATVNPVEGIAIAKKELPDMVMVDGMMPEMSGWEVCSALRAEPDLSELRIVMFSAVSEAEQKLAGFNAGADDYLTKPTEPTEMIERVKILLENVTPRSTINTEQPTNVPTQTLTFEELGIPIPPLSTSIQLPKETTLIAVMGVRGGSGSTTTAINVAAALAHAGHSTTLIDLDVQQGHVALYLKQDTSQQFTQFVQGDFYAMQDNVIHFTDSLNLLVAQTPAWENGSVDMTQETVSKILEAMAANSSYLVVDCGNQLLPFVKPIVERADDIIVCLRPERLSLTVAKERIQAMQDVMMSQAKIRPIVMDFSGHMNVPKDGIEKFLGMKLTAIVPITAKEMNLAVSKSKPLVQLDPQAKPSILMRQLAQQIIKV